MSPRDASSEHKGSAKRLGRPTITAEVEQAIRDGLRAGRTPKQIREKLRESVALSTIYRVKQALDLMATIKAEEDLKRTKRAEQMAQDLLKRGRNVTEALDEVHQATGVKLKVQFSPTRTAERPRKAAASTRAKR